MHVHHPHKNSLDIALLALSLLLKRCVSTFYVKTHGVDDNDNKEENYIFAIALKPKIFKNT